MPSLCAVSGCGHNTKREKGKFSFFRIPTVIENQGEETRNLSFDRRRKWLKNIYRKADDLTESKTKNTRVCSSHFHTGMPAALYDRHNADWAPTVNMGHTNIKDESDAIARGKRAADRLKRKRTAESGAPNARQKLNFSVEINSGGGSSGGVNECLAPENVSIVPNFTEEVENEKGCQAGCDSKTIACQTDLTMGQLEVQESVMRETTTELCTLKSKLLDAQLNYESFSSNNDKTKFYTGLPNFLVFIHLLNFLSPFVKSTKRNALVPFQELLLVLMKLRMNFPFQDLVYRFQISTSTASRIFDRWIHVMAIRLSFLIHWPDRDQLQKTMPAIFKQNFGNSVAVIIDCFEVFIDRPSSLIARAMTWSNYKHHNTIKFLIGITPQGSVSYLSKAWGGRVSDKYLTENCNFLRKLYPGDVVLADRGFNISDSVGLHRAKLYIPKFTRGKKQLPAEDVEITRKIANVRIHVERVIGLVRRKYVILQSTVPIDLLKTKLTDTLSTIDKIARVCCALTNLSESIVPFQ